MSSSFFEIVARLSEIGIVTGGESFVLRFPSQTQAHAVNLPSLLHLGKKWIWLISGIFCHFDLHLHYWNNLKRSWFLYGNPHLGRDFTCLRFDRLIELWLHFKSRFRDLTCSEHMHFDSIIFDQCLTQGFALGSLPRHRFVFHLLEDLNFPLLGFGAFLFVDSRFCFPGFVVYSVFAGINLK